MTHKNYFFFRKLRTLVGYIFRSMYFVGSANYIKVKGVLSSPKEAPILVGAPHSSFFDALAVLISGPSSVVGKVEAGDIPFYGSNFLSISPKRSL